ncbi:MAG: hypothetical protein ACLU4J_18325 [Butyricimonas paravirosa]
MFLLNGFYWVAWLLCMGKHLIIISFHGSFHAVTRKDSFVKDLQTGGKICSRVWHVFYLYIVTDVIYNTELYMGRQALLWDI